MAHIQTVISGTLVILLLLILVGLPVEAVEKYPCLSESEQQAVDLINADRKINGLPSLKVNLALAQVARRHATDMLQRDYFSHQNLEGDSPFDRMKKAGISYTVAGENLYKGLNDPIGQDVVIGEQFLMGSPGHKRNILHRDFTEVGVGVVRDDNGWIYLVQCYIRADR